MKIRIGAERNGVSWAGKICTAQRAPSHEKMLEERKKKKPTITRLLIDLDR